MSERGAHGAHEERIAVCLLGVIFAFLICSHWRVDLKPLHQGVLADCHGNAEIVPALDVMQKSTLQMIMNNRHGLLWT